VTLNSPVMVAWGGRSARNTVQLLHALTIRDLKLRYQGSIFGWAWSMLRPLALGAILSFALGKVLGTGIGAVFLLCGLFPWFWFQGSVQMSTTTFVGNGGLLKKVRFPREVLPVSVVLGQTLQFALALPVLLAFVIGAGDSPAWAWLPGIPLLFVLQLALILGLSLLFASVTVFFRDLEHLVEVGLTLVFYGTPIIYDIDRIPQGYAWMIWLNPLAPLMEGWRDVLLRGDLPGVNLAATAGLAVGFMAIGWFSFRRLEDSFADVV
jgi:ABC-type polysaccharide/polyol phosphate export permease